MCPDGHSPESPEHDPVGTVLGERYRLEALIDEGAMGRVYLAEHVHMRKRFAVKVLRKELTRVPEVVARFEREAMAAAHIEHPNVAAATDFGKLPDGSIYLVLEYVEGRTLRQALSEGPLSIERSLRIARQVAAGLSAAHCLDIVHRDLKPENVMLVCRGADEDFVKVLDFGVAKIPIDMTAGIRPASIDGNAKQITKAGMVFGTPDYMSPEQALGQAVDHRADLYSLGVILFELLTGQRPFKANQELGILGQQLSNGPPSLGALCTEVSGAVEQLVRGLMANEASERPASAEVVVSLLGQQLQVMGVPVEPLPIARDPMPTPPPGTVGLDGSPPSDVEPGSQRDSDSRPSENLSSRRWSTPWLAILLPLAALGAFALLLQYLSRPASSQHAAASTSSVGPAAPARATEEQLSEALKAGELAVKALAERFPRDGSITVAEARLLLRKGRARQALALLKEVLNKDPAVREDARLASVLWRLVQRAEMESEVFSLLTDALGSKGADIIFDLATTAGVRPRLVARSRGWLAEGKFSQVATATTLAAGRLLLSQNCAARKALVHELGTSGDRRGVVALRLLASRSICRAGEGSACLDCLAEGELARAIAGIEARSAPRR